MSQYTDDTLNRYLDQQPGMREALHTDPVQHAQTELMRRTLAAVERALADEDVPDEVRRRVVNRIVWGEPEGRVDFYAKRREVQEQVLAAYDLPTELTAAWAEIHASAGPVSGEETSA
ncbi:hypothetical protein [Streptomyces sp. NPDC057257]|uniref:hypothetical protein n=1 Tax=Streptomyces sp. NPDC057257 TaxID=3346071 RepID=UPI00362FDBAD